jgi:hypothetical protein
MGGWLSAALNTWKRQHFATSGCCRFCRKQSINLMTRIDEVFEDHGGWPGAFAGRKEGGE